MCVGCGWGLGFWFLHGSVFGYDGDNFAPIANLLLDKDFFFGQFSALFVLIWAVSGRIYISH